MLNSPGSPIRGASFASQGCQSGDDIQEIQTVDKCEDTPQESQTDVGWTFAFEQILASLLNEPVLVTFFEKPFDVKVKIEQVKSVQLRAKNQPKVYE